MALFGFLKPEKPAGFTYRPRFLEEGKNDLERRLKEAKETRGDDPEMVKERIRRNIRRKGSQLSDKSFRQKQLVRSNIIILLLIVGMVLVTYAVLELYLPKIVKYFE